MGRKLEKLGIGIVAVMALGLAVTSIAGAANFTASGYPASFEGEGGLGTWTFTTEVGSSECRASASGTLNAASSTVTISSTGLSECRTSNQATTANTEGCDALVHLTGGSGHTYTGSGDLVCPAGKSIVATGANCEVQIPAQAGGVTIEYTNNTAEGYVEAEVTSSNITYVVTKDGFLCPYSGTGVRTGGTIAQSGPTPVKYEGGTADIG
jgi:hypothetical protein